MKQPKKDRKRIEIDGIPMFLEGWTRDAQIGVAYVVLKALKGDKQAKDILDGIGFTYFDTNGVQVYPPQK
jgi:hypothetical protein